MIDKQKLMKFILIMIGILLLVAALRIVHGLNSQTLTEYANQQELNTEE